MALQTGGQVRVDVDLATAFDFVGDPVRLAQCIPGCGDLRELSPGRYSAVLTNVFRVKSAYEIFRTG